MSMNRVLVLFDYTSAIWAWCKDNVSGWLEIGISLELSPDVGVSDNITDKREKQKRRIFILLL